MNLRFWEWDRVFNLVFVAAIFALAGSILIASIEIPVATDLAGDPILNTIWDEFGILGALLLVLLPVLISVSPLMVLSMRGGIGRRQLVNLWLALLLYAGYLLLFQQFVLVYLLSISFLLSAAVAGLVRRRSTAVGRTAGNGSRDGQARGGGIRVSNEARKQGRRRGRGR